MTMIDRLDPELAAAYDVFVAATGGGFSLHDIAATRAMLDGMIAAIKEDAPAIDGVDTEDVQIPGFENAPNVAIRIYRPAAQSATLPAMLWMHAGGYVVGGIEMDDLMNRQLAKDLRCVIVSIEYRLAPEHPFPAALDDGYAALKWLSSHADELRIDPSRIAIGGASAGGGLTAGLALVARDRGEVSAALQLLIYPSIDDSNVEQASDAVPDSLFWSRENCLTGWRAYLGREPGGDDVSEYAAAYRATDLSGLPPAYIAVGDLDQFLNDSVDYARRLVAAGVPTELHVYPGACHALEVFGPMARVSQRFVADRDDALRRALHR